MENKELTFEEPKLKLKPSSILRPKSNRGAYLFMGGGRKVKERKDGARKVKKMGRRQEEMEKGLMVPRVLCVCVCGVCLLFLFLLPFDFFSCGL